MTPNLRGPNKTIHLFPEWLVQFSYYSQQYWKGTSGLKQTFPCCRPSSTISYCLMQDITYYFFMSWNFTNCRLITELLLCLFNPKLIFSKINFVRIIELNTDNAKLKVVLGRDTFHTHEFIRPYIKYKAFLDSEYCM